MCHHYLPCGKNLTLRKVFQPTEGILGKMVGFVSRVLGEIKKASKRNTRPLSPVSRLRMKLLAGGPEAVGEKQAELDSTFLRRLMMREPHT